MFFPSQTRRSTCSLGLSRFLQLALILALAWTLITHSFSVHRTPLAIWTAVALVFTVSGTDEGIYGDQNADISSSLEAMGAGYLILSFVNVSAPCPSIQIRVSRLSDLAQWPPF